MNRLLSSLNAHNIPLSEKQISEYLVRQFRATDSCTSVLTEVNIKQGTTRIDQLILDQHTMHGIEIKSDGDKLTRLKRQIRQYLQVVDFLTIVGTPGNIMRIYPALPANVGLLMVYSTTDGLHHVTIRTASLNLRRCPLSIAQLLWKNETIDTLRHLGDTASTVTETRQQLWQRLSRHSDHDTLSQQVVKHLRNRYYATT
jgi:hypothetical protein